MPTIQQQADQIARRYGIPPNVFRALIKQESGWRPGVVSPAGAIGFTQLMPGTAAGLGVNPHDPVQNLQGGARYLSGLLHRFKSLPLALAAYNAGPEAVARAGGIPHFTETRNYVHNIMAMAGANALPAHPQASARLQTGPVPPLMGPVGQTRTPASAPRPGADLASLLQFAAPSQASLGILQRLGGTAGRVAQASESPIPLPGSATPMPTMPTARPPAGGLPPLAMPTAPGRVGGRGGRIAVAPGANRPGVGLHPDILGFAKLVSRTYGKRLTITTGTQHNQFVLGTNRQSAHWTGEAADIAMRGKALTRLGQAALIAAGADPKWAHQQQGGLFNIGGRQIIFNSMEGGNHYNHLHIGIRGHG